MMNGKRIKKIFLTGWPWLLIVIVFLLRLPSMFEPFTYADEGIYLTLGQALKKGLVLYRDIHDNKPPFIYLLGAFTGNFFNYRLLLLVWSLATIFIFYRLAQLLFKKNKISSFLTTTIFTVLISLPFLEGNIANAENFMMLPTIGGFYLMVKILEQAKVDRGNFIGWFSAGILFCIAVLFKVPALFDFLAAVLLCLFFLSKKTFKITLSRLFFLFLGFLIPLVLTFLYFLSKHALYPYLSAAFLQNLPYLSTWGSKAKVGSLPLALLGRGFIFFLVAIIIFLLRHKTSLSIKIILIWFFASAFAALLSSRPYPHYLLQILPSFSLTFGFLTLPKAKIWLKSLPIFLTIIFVFIFLGFHFWYYPNWSYYQNFYQFTFRQKSQQAYFQYFDRQTEDIYQTAAFIKSHSLSQEKIFIWGTRPSIYVLAKRLPATRYIVSYHIIDFNGYEETMENLMASPPHWLIDTQDEKQPFPQLKEFIETNYILFRQIGNFKIYYHLPKIARL